MTDDLYTLYLDAFTLKAAGVDGELLMRSLPDKPTMQQRAVIALALADASLPSSVSTRIAVAEAIEQLLEGSSR